MERVYRDAIAAETTDPDRSRMNITRYRPEDRDRLAAFNSRMFGPDSPQANPDRHSWLFQDNPYNEGAEASIWLYREPDAETGADEIAGQQAEVPFELRVGRDERRAWWAVDMTVDGRWRLPGAGPALVNVQAEDKGIVAAAGLPDDAYAACTQAGWTDLGTVPLYVRPLDVKGTRRAFRAGQARLRSRIVGTVAAALGRLREACELARRFVELLRGVRLVGVDRLDERSDKVWSSSADSYAVLARRDRDALTWRIDQRPDADRLERHYLVRRRRTVGYVVVRPSEMSDERVAVVLDYLAPPEWVAPLLTAAGRAAAKDGAVALLVRTRNEPAEARLRRRGFVRSDKKNKRPARFVINCTDEAGICALVQAPEMWFVTAADGDLEHSDPRRAAGRDGRTDEESQPSTGSGDQRHRRAGPMPDLP